MVVVGGGMTLASGDGGCDGGGVDTDGWGE